MQQTLDSYP